MKIEDFNPVLYINHDLEDKPCYPSEVKIAHGENECSLFQTGISFRERLIISLAGNPTVCAFSEENYSGNARDIISQADAIIKEMEK